jgi:arsenate reductase-like glutaredoxin family protein
MTCKKAGGFLAANVCSVVDTTDSNKQKIGPAEALKLLSGVKHLICIMRGKHVFRYDLIKERPDDATLLAHMMGPTGNLRAPTVRIGSTLVVGYNEDTYREVLGL